MLLYIMETDYHMPSVAENLNRKLNLEIFEQLEFNEI